MCSFSLRPDALYRVNPALAWVPLKGSWLAVPSHSVEFARATRGQGYRIDTDLLPFLASFAQPTLLARALTGVRERFDIDDATFFDVVAELLASGVVQNLDQTVEVLVVSPAGVESDGLIRFLNCHLLASDPWNETRLRYLPRPLCDMPGLRGALFVGGDVPDAIQRTFQRGVHTAASYYLTYQHRISPNDTLEDYARGGQDTLGINAQVAAWTDAGALSKLPYPVAYVDSRDLCQNADRVLDFVGLPGDLAESLVRELKLHSSFKPLELPPGTRKTLCDMYRDSMERLDALRPFRIQHVPKPLPRQRQAQCEGPQDSMRRDRGRDPT